MFYLFWKGKKNHKVPLFIVPPYFPTFSIQSIETKSFKKATSSPIVSYLGTSREQQGSTATLTGTLSLDLRLLQRTISNSISSGSCRIHLAEVIVFLKVWAEIILCVCVLFSGYKIACYLIMICNPFNFDPVVLISFAYWIEIPLKTKNSNLRWLHKYTGQHQEGEQCFVLNNCDHIKVYTFFILLGRGAYISRHVGSHTY